MHNAYWGMGWGMWFIPLLIILVIYFFIKINSQKGNVQTMETPIDILKRRYAGGELTKEQFDEMKENIGAVADD